MSEEQMTRIKAVKEAYEGELLQKANVVGVGIGLRERGGEFTQEPAIIVSVTHKVDWRTLDPQDVIPHELEGVPVDVQAIGTPRAL